MPWWGTNTHMLTAIAEQEYPSSIPDSPQYPETSPEAPMPPEEIPQVPEMPNVPAPTPTV